jgi:hypothetical protein
MKVIAECALDEPGLTAQRDRAARLAREVVRAERRDGSLTFVLHDGFDRDLLGELLAVERECCPFFIFAMDEESSTLCVRVEDPQLEPALDAFAWLLQPRAVSQ